MLVAIVMACGQGSGEIKQASGANPPTKMGVLVGRVTMGPMPPIAGGGPAPPGPVPGGSTAPLPGAKILVLDTTGRKFGSVVTNNQGLYSIKLPPGAYRIGMAPLSGGMFTKDLPAIVTITEGQETRLDILVDTGIR